MRCGVRPETLIVLIVSAVTMLYLLYALLRPEKF
jgi:K+-transporting ATPase KdpF subunit